jgi:hypothetical protein
MPVTLHEDEEKLRELIVKRVEQLRKIFDEDSFSDNVSSLIREAGKAAHALHLKLKARGLEPKHHAYMVKNRDLQPDDPNFYLHFHPLEDLLKFLNDPQANDDPVDRTIGAEFKFRVYSRRWKHDDVYQMIRTKTGWNIRALDDEGACDKGGNPVLFRNLNRDCINYPVDLDDWLSDLWDKAARQGLNKEQVQQGLDDIAEWVSQTEKNTPNGGLWKAYA